MERVLRPQLQALYAEHNPSKLPELEGLMVKYGVTYLWEMAQRKYAAHDVSEAVEEGHEIRLVSEVAI